MALTVAQSGGRPNPFPGVIRAGVKRANKVLDLLNGQEEADIDPLELT